MYRLATASLASLLILAGCAATPSAGPASRAPSSSPKGVALADQSTRPSAVNGRGRNQGLPPGIAKNLAVGKPLPPGIAKQQVPAQVLVKLPKPRDGFEYVIVAGKVLLIEIATQIVREILVDVLFDN